MKLTATMKFDDKTEMSESIFPTPMIDDEVDQAAIDAAVQSMKDNAAQIALVTKRPLLGVKVTIEE